MNILETNALTKIYGSMRAVDELDMRVAEGDIYGFVGKNGAGKSTTMNMVAGLATPTSGEIRLFGSTGPDAVRRASSFSSEPSRIGVLIEEPGVIPNLSAYENLMAKALSLGVVRALPRPAFPRRTRRVGRAQGEEVLHGHEAAPGRRARPRGLARPAAP